MKTYSLAEVDELALPEDWTDGVRWLARRLNRGEIRGYRVGRIWRMTQAHLDWFIEHFSNTVQVAAPAEESVESTGPVSILAGMSERGRARVLRQQERRFA